MFRIIIISSYILVPLISTLVFKRLRIKWWKHLTYIFTITLIFFCPSIIFYLYTMPHMDCGLFYSAIFLGNTFIGLPIAALIQFLFNKLLV
jgi:hypothetical protein